MSLQIVYQTVRKSIMYAQIYSRQPVKHIFYPIVHRKQLVFLHKVIKKSFSWWKQLKIPNISYVVSQDKINRKRLNILAVPSSTELLKDCPSPFVKDTLASIGDGQTTDKTFCLAGCCAPCPLQNFVNFIIT